VSHALVQAFAVGAVTAAFGYISQAQFNPAVTLTMVVLVRAACCVSCRVLRSHCART
jgi:glycerol uptake facilitator-like aquaporin